MKAAIAAYRTHDQAKLDIYTAWQDDLAEHKERVNAFWDHVDPERKLTLRARRGFIPAYFEGSEAPAGWRRNKNGRVVPDKRLKAGKLAYSAMEELRKGAPSDLPARLGIPPHSFVGNHFYEPGIFMHDAAVYVHCGAELEGIDLNVWDELKQSEFYAAQESYEGDAVNA